MATIAGFKKQYEQLYGNSGEGVRNILSNEVNKTSDVILDLNRDQLLYGRDAEGKLLTPEYTDDPYFNQFKNPWEAATNYAMNKKRMWREHQMRQSYTQIQLFPEKPGLTPNLLINGKLFFNHFFINVSDNSYTVGSSGLVASDIEAKYGKVYGLAPASRNFYYQNWLRPALWANILKHLGKR